MKRQPKNPQAELDLGGHSPAKSQPPAVVSSPAAKLARAKLLPVRHLDRDFFLCDLFDYSLKDDNASMEAPIFSLAIKPDKDEWHWASKDGTRQVQVIPSVRGRATQMDKDVLIYIISQLTEGLNRERSDTENRRIRFTVYDYLVSTNKPTGGGQYAQLDAALDRLAGTRIKTNIRTGGISVKENFGIITRYRIVEKSPTDDRMIALEVELSEWTYNAVMNREVLTINPDYFRLRRPLERRLYEIARKHCGHQTTWAIDLELLQAKAGSKCALREFRRMLREIIDADILPDYRISLSKTDKVTFYVKSPARLLAGLETKPK